MKKNQQLIYSDHFQANINEQNQRVFFHDNFYINLIQDDLAIDQLIDSVLYSRYYYNRYQENYDTSQIIKNIELSLQNSQNSQNPQNSQNSQNPPFSSQTSPSPMDTYSSSPEYQFLLNQSAFRPFPDRFSSILTLLTSHGVKLHENNTRSYTKYTGTWFMYYSVREQVMEKYRIELMKRELSLGNDDNNSEQNSTQNSLSKNRYNYLQSQSYRRFQTYSPLSMTLKYSQPSLYQYILPDNATIERKLEEQKNYPTQNHPQNPQSPQNPPNFTIQPVNPCILPRLYKLRWIKYQQLPTNALSLFLWMWICRSEIEMGILYIIQCNDYDIKHNIPICRK